MKKAFFVSCIAFFILLSFSCAKKSKNVPGAAEHQSYNIKFWGFKTSAKVKASPEEVEKYMGGPTNLVRSAGTVKLKIISGDRFDKKGDSVVFQGQLMGTPMTIQVWLMVHVPGKEKMFVCLLNDSIMGFVRYRLTKLEDGTKVETEFEIEQTNPLLSGVFEILNLNETALKIQNESLVRMQKYFEPGMSDEALGSAKNKGEAIDKPYQAHQISLFINASPEKVAEYVASPEFNEMLRSRYNLDFGNALIDRKTGIYNLNLNFLGAKTSPEVLVCSYQFQEHIFVYWLGKINSRIQFFFKPESGGTELIIAYTLEPPSSFGGDLTQILMNTVNIPNMLEQVMLEIKGKLEGSA